MEAYSNFHSDEPRFGPWCCYRWVVKVRAELGGGRGNWAVKEPREKAVGVLCDYFALGEAHAGTLRSLVLLEGMALTTVPGGCLGDGVPHNKPYPRQGSSEPPRSPIAPVACRQRMGCDGRVPRSQPQGSPIATPQGCPHA